MRFLLLAALLGASLYVNHQGMRYEPPRHVVERFYSNRAIPAFGWVRSEAKDLIERWNFESFLDWNRG